MDQHVVDLEDAGPHADEAADRLGLQPGVAVAEALVEPPRGIVRAAVTEADPCVAALDRQRLCSQRERRRDAAAAAVLTDEHVLDLGDAQTRPLPGDVRMSQRLAALPRDEVGLMVRVPGERQALADARDVVLGQLADVDAATNRRKKVNAPPLSSISFKLPHFGLCTQEGQPSLHGHPSSIRAVSPTQPSKALKPRSVIPTP